MKRTLKIDRTWTLFLDRDGVINKKLEDDYVKCLDEFEFLPGVLSTIPILNSLFARTLITTNQRGIARNLMTKEDLSIVHEYMLNEVQKFSGKIDKIYFCPHDRHENCGCRKPQPGMALQAQKDFPQIDFSKSLIIGDSISDMKFGKSVGMKTVFISKERIQESCIDCIYPNLKSVAQSFEERNL